MKWSIARALAAFGGCVMADIATLLLSAKSLNGESCERTSVALAIHLAAQVRRDRVNADQTDIANLLHC
jgi:hypothetical protein